MAILPDGGAIELHPDSLPDQQREDALNWILFGELAADAAARHGGYTRITDPVKWYKSFVGFLGRIGMQSHGCDRRQASKNELGGTVSETALRLLSPLLRDDEPRLAQQAFHDLQHGNERALRTFNETASDNSGVNFLLIGASVDAYLNLILHLTFIDFQTSEHVGNILYWSWNRNKVKALFYGKDTLILPKTIADRSRSGLRKRLETRVPRHIAPIHEDSGH